MIKIGYFLFIFVRHPVLWPFSAIQFHSRLVVLTLVIQVQLGRLWTILLSLLP